MEGTTKRIAEVTFPVLSRLGLSDNELSALTRQGSVLGERRGAKTVFRLRFRVDGRQRVRYVSSQDVDALKVELASLQKAVRARRRLTDVATFARQLLRQRKSTLAPQLEERGYHFHGHSIRRYRDI